jgi:transcription elongation GreA/GreB family factor
MSRAFVKERDDGDSVEDLPDRPISPHPNVVTPEGLAQIEAELTRYQHEQAAAQEADDRAALARANRELRYWTTRRGSAQVRPHPTDTRQVQFGSTVTIGRGDGRQQTFRIVGEDEADPAHGTLSYVAPVARALMGGKVGDTVRAGPSDAEILSIS